MRGTPASPTCIALLGVDEATQSRNCNRTLDGDNAVGACSRLTEPFLHRTTDLQPIHAVQAQALERAPLGREILTGHAPDNLDERVNRWRPPPCRCTQCAHRDQAGRNVFGDEFVIERLWRARRLIGPLAVVGEPLTGL